VQTFEHTYMFEPLTKGTKYVTLKPYSGGYHRGEAAAKLGVLPVEVHQGEIGTVTVTKLERLKDKTILHYDIKGDDPLAQAGPVWLLDANKKPVIISDLYALIKELYFIYALGHKGFSELISFREYDLRSCFGTAGFFMSGNYFQHISNDFFIIRE
jgi:hypothetical protein